MNSTAREEFYFPGYNASIFRVEEQPKQESSHACCLLHANFLLDMFSALKIEVIYTSETSVDVQRTIRFYARRWNSA
jgi:hypothetical protein